tara:strand:- start:190 stop:330 length:141 start_codon:yes stop_codon:yes gene_type:complete
MGAKEGTPELNNFELFENTEDEKRIVDIRIVLISLFMSLILCFKLT